MSKTKFFEVKPGFNLALGWDMSKDYVSNRRRNRKRKESIDDCYVTISGRRSIDNYKAVQLSFDTEWML